MRARTSDTRILAAQRALFTFVATHESTPDRWIEVQLGAVTDEAVRKLDNADVKQWLLRDCFSLNPPMQDLVSAERGQTGSARLG